MTRGREIALRPLRNGLVVGLAFAIVALMGATGAAAQHGPLTDHLLGTGATGKLEFVSKLVVPDAENDLIADVAVFGNYAYLARWGGSACEGPEKRGQQNPDGGSYVIDISDPANPKLVNFIAAHQDTLVGEGQQVIHVDTAQFTGDVLLMNHEQCGKNGKGGFSLWDVTDPLHAKKLAENFGDFTNNDALNHPHDANQTHSAFMWDAGPKAYLVSVDDDEPSDVDIYDITDPKHPQLLTELDINALYHVDQPELGLDETFFHDVVVKQIAGRWIMLLSYWDGGWVLLDVGDPAHPIFLGDTDFPAVDPLLLEKTGTSVTPEGNAHQAEFTSDNRYFIGTSEDFGPYRAEVTTDDDSGVFRAKLGSPAPQLTATLTGQTVFVGRACTGDAAIPAGDGTQIALIERGLCTFSEKLANVEAAGGYVAAIIMNREGADACSSVLSPFVEASIPVIFVGRDTGFKILDLPNYNEAECRDANVQRLPDSLVGTKGDVVTIHAIFDGWGYVWLYGFGISGNSASFNLLDTYAIPEAMNPAFANGFGALSVHEVAVDPLDPSLAYLSYYAGGIRAIQIVNNSLVEVGSFLDPRGNEFWGIETKVINGRTYIFGSDMDSGLWILRDP
jgi:hypothetical protein